MAKTIMEVMKEIPDYRKGNGIRHTISDILMIGLLTIICNGNDYAGMYIFGKTNEELLKKFLELPHGIPSQDTFERVFAKLNPKALARMFLIWVDEIRDTIQGYITAGIEGKTVRRSRDTGKKAVHIVTAFASELKLVLGQLATDEKSNEITAIPRLLEMFCRKGMVITIDAMGTQIAIAEKIIGLGGDYVLSLKGNQQTLLENIALYLTNEVMTQDKKVLRANGQYERTIEKGHGRIETRECFITREIEWLEEAANWAGLAGAGVIISACFKRS